MATRPKPAPSRPPGPRKPVAAAVEHAFAGLDDWIEVFTAGEHTDSQGRTKAFSQDDLDQMVANVTGTGVPAVLGHPKETDRAWAWGKLKREGSSLLALFSDVDPTFRALVDAGAYRERSIATYQDKKRGWVVNHIGWLGAVPPALALQPLAYSRAAGAPALPEAPADAELMEYAAADAADTGWALGDVARLMRGLREWFIAEHGMDVADRVLPDWTLTSVADAGRRLSDPARTEPAPAFSAAPASAAPSAPPSAPPSAAPAADPTGDPPMPFSQADLDRVREEARTAAERETQTRLEAQFAAQGAELTTLRAQRLQERVQTQINAWKAGGQLLPAEEPGLAAFMAALESGPAGGEFTFKAADGAEARQTPAAWFAAFVAARRAVRLGRPVAEPEADADTVDTSDYRAVAAKAQEWRNKEAAAGRVVSAAQAVAHVSASGTA
jgi:hypothetical protein